MPAHSKPKAKDAAPVTRSAPFQLSFVTANNPEQFKDKAVMRRVRKAVMHNFLNEAKNDPNSTDARVRYKRASVARYPTSVSSTASDTVSLPSPSMQNSTETAPSRRDSRALAGFSTESYIEGVSRAIPATTIAHDEPSLTSDAQGIEKLIRPLQFASTKPQSSGTDPTSFATSSLPSDWTNCASFVKYIEEAQDFFNAYSQEKDRRDRQLRPDPFASCEPLPSTLDLKLLKANCTKYFGSYAMAKQWVPLQLKSREAFLGSLCISAPYTDLMSLKGAESKARPDSQQTLEILDILPRMIGLTLNDPVARSSDSNFIAILQLFCGELTSQYTDMLAWHPSVLKMLVNERGGLDKLGGQGVIASNVTITSLEANVLQNQSADNLYTTWTETYLARKPFQRQLAPEGPLYSTTQGMKSFAGHKWCLPQTLNLVLQMHNLTESLLRLERLEAEWASAEISDSAKERERSNLNQDLTTIVDAVHDLPTCHDLGLLDQAGWIYETVRQTALLYSRAIWYRKPFHQAWKLSCYPEKSHHFSSRTGHCHVTPESIQSALEKTPMFEVWDRLAGVLYWVLMVSAAGCYEPPVDDYMSERVGPKTHNHHGAKVDKVDSPESLRRKGPHMTRSSDAFSAGSAEHIPSTKSDQQGVHHHQRQNHSPSDHKISADQFREIMSNVDSSLPGFAGHPHAFATVPMSRSAPRPVPSPMQPAHHTCLRFRYDPSELEASSPDSISSNQALQRLRDTDAWYSRPQSGHASGTHTPSPPSSAPSSVAGATLTDNSTTSVPSTSNFNFSPYFTPSYPANLHAPEDETDLSWDAMFNMFLAGNPVVQEQMDHQYPMHHQQQQSKPPPPSQVTLDTGREPQSHQTTNCNDPVDGNSKRTRRAPAKTKSFPSKEEQAREHHAFFKRYLTANAVRVSILLRFEHTVAVVDGLYKLVQCQRVLNRAWTRRDNFRLIGCLGQGTERTRGPT